MGPWFRVFGRLDVIPPPASLAEGVEMAVDADVRGWYRAVIDLDGGGSLQLERWSADEEGIRAELNGWAAYLETCDRSPHHVPLMERMIQTRQVYTIRKAIDCPDEARADRLCVALCQRLAAATDGVYQVDGEGFHAADGTVLVKED